MIDEVLANCTIEAWLVIELQIGKKFDILVKLEEIHTYLFELKYKVQSNNNFNQY